MSGPTDLDRFRALFLLAGIDVANVHELPNNYWPDAYVELRADHPWALMMTPFGGIKIGLRKRVISISWKDTPLRQKITEDDVTNELELVHAWSYVKALEYLTALRKALSEQAACPPNPSPPVR